MQLFIKKQIGKTPLTFVVEGKNLFEVQMEAQKLSFYDVHKCGVCDSDDLRLNAYITNEDKFEYTKIVCNKCRASLIFGQKKKSPDTFYLRRNDDKKLDWVVYEDDKKKVEDTVDNLIPPIKESDNSELPF